MVQMEKILYANFYLFKMAFFLQKHRRGNLIFCFKMSALLLLGPKPAEKGRKSNLVSVQYLSWRKRILQNLKRANSAEQGM